MFATCEYSDGIIHRANTWEPHLARIGLANKHLQSGYPEVWDLKDSAINQTTKLCDEIEALIKSYEKMVIEDIEASFSDLGKTSKLSGKDNGYEPTHDKDNIYYKVSLLDTIFVEATEYFRKGESSYSSGIYDPQLTDHQFTDHRGHRTSFLIMKLGTGKYTLGYGTERAMGELQLRCQQIIPNSSTQEIVKKYQDLTHQLNKNSYVSEFHNRIDNLWQRINEDGELLNGEGSCDDCPKKSYLDYF